MMATSVVASPVKVAATDFSRAGVKSGDWAKYFFTLSNASEEWRMRETVNFTNVAGNTVTLNLTAYNLDGSKNASIVYVGNVSTSLATVHVPGYGNLTAPMLWQYILPANLSAHDPLFSGGLYIINETIPMMLLNAPRQVNHLNITQTSFFSLTPDEIVNYYWDRQTGVMVLQEEHAFDMSMRSNMTLTDTSLWHQPEAGGQGQLVFGLSLLQWLLIGGVAAVIVVASAALVIRRHRRTTMPSIISTPS
jgi:hypothetical protein